MSWISYVMFSIFFLILPFFVYVMFKMATLGVLKAKEHIVEEERKRGEDNGRLDARRSRQV